MKRASQKITQLGLALLLIVPSTVLAKSNKSAAAKPAPTRAPITSNEPKGPTDITKKMNAAVLTQLPFADKQDFNDAQRGFIMPLPGDQTIKDDQGEVRFDAKQFLIPPNASAPDSVNPSTWRIDQLNGYAGLFKVVDRIYQVRGVDVSNITFIEGSKGIIVVDPLTSKDAAKAALALYFANRPKKPVTAVIYTHSHIDHFAGVRGVISNEDMKAGTKVIAPAGFTEEAVSENVFAGNAMLRRATYMYGFGLPIGPNGTYGSGLGVIGPTAEATLVLPTDFVTKTGQKMTIDGLTFEFLIAPGSEAPAEMHFYIEELKALCPAENVSHVLHNFYTLRGAKTRDIAKWVKYLNQTLDMWGDKAEVMFAPHHWPTWGNAQIVQQIENYRDAFKFIHDQSLHLANQGHTMNEIGNLVKLPPALDQNWATRGYYGSVSHDARAVYNYYLGYFSGNPADLNPYSPVEAAKRYVEYMGGRDQILAKAQRDFKAGDYRWVAEVTKQLIYADPSDRDARYLQADAFEQLGYQSEAATWRNIYLMGAKELRDGVRPSQMASTSGGDMVEKIPTDLLLDSLAIGVDPQKAEGKDITINLTVADTNESFAWTLRNGVMNHRSKLAKKPTVAVSLPKASFTGVLARKTTFDKEVEAGRATVKGYTAAFNEMLSTIDQFPFWFNIVTPN